MKNTIDLLLVIKHRHILQLKCGDEIIKTYTVALGKDPVGAKAFEGDLKTPEGTRTRMKPKRPMPKRWVKMPADKYASMALKMILPATRWMAKRKTGRQAALRLPMPKWMRSTK
jgi:L,D-peptidoglycan transpeptidase YkuD (ErfK/YbiS/YcfS/YnhG family)